MTYPRICVAGIEVETGIHIRPIVGKKDFLEYSMVGHNQLFRLGRIIDLGWYIQRSQVPEVEDVYFKPKNAVVIQDLQATEFWQQLDEVAESSLGMIFGDELQSVGRTFALSRGAGQASLGELRTGKVKLELRKADSGLKLRATFDCVGLEVAPSVPVTDLRFFEQVDEHYVSNASVITKFNNRLEIAQNIILSVGLSRAWSVNDQSESMHWLQINGIHLESDPLWQI
jgi:hypothetical protein